jgi:hypothetical protein
MGPEPVEDLVDELGVLRLERPQDHLGAVSQHMRAPPSEVDRDERGMPVGEGPLLRHLLLLAARLFIEVEAIIWTSFPSADVGDGHLPTDTLRHLEGRTHQWCPPDHVLGAGERHWHRERPAVAEVHHRGRTRA